MVEKGDVFWRYASGDHIGAWDSLKSIDSRGEVAEPLRAVVRMFVERAADNFERLVANLMRMGYKFHSPSPFVRLAQRPASVVQSGVDEHLPLLLREWYSVIAHVDLRQDVEQMRDPTSDLVSLGFNCTAVFLSYDEGRRMTDEDDLTPLDYDVEPPRPVRGSPFVCLGAFASNCEPIGYWAERDPFDPIVYDDGGGPVSMADHVRDVLRWGGFPLWESMVLTPERGPILRLHPDFPRLLSSLRRGLVDL